MTLTNNTSVTLKILGGTLEPNETGEYYEAMFNTLNIHSDIGSCEIVTVYGHRIIHNYGKLKAEEGEEKNEHGMKNILVTSD